MGDKNKKEAKKPAAAPKPAGATPMSSMSVGKISKNQRAFAKQEQAEVLCAGRMEKSVPKGAGEPPAFELVRHKMVNVLVAGQGFRRLCACDGYAPIDTSAPYKQIKPSGVAGKKADGVKGGRATWTGAA